MHIMHLVTRLLRAGSEENTVSTCIYQASIGHRVTLVHGADFDPFWYRNAMEGIELICIPELDRPINLLQDLRAFFRLQSLYRKMRPDVIHTHQSKAGILGRLAAKVLPNLTVAHGVHILSWEGMPAVKRKALIAIERFAGRKTDVFLAVSTTLCRAYEDANIAQSGMVTCVRSGMDLQRFREGELPQDWRELLGLERGCSRPRVALMLAAFEPRKRHAAFLKSYAKLGGSLSETKVILAGQGSEETKLRALVCELGLQGRVIFCGHRSDPEALLALADVLVLTSKREGLPRVVVQAMAAGVPAIVNDLPGIDEVVQHGHNGLIAAGHDVNETVHEMMKLFGNEALLNRLSSGALDTNLDDWNLDHLGERTTTLYQFTGVSMGANSC